MGQTETLRTSESGQFGVGEEVFFPKASLLRRENVDELLEVLDRGLQQQQSVRFDPGDVGGLLDPADIQEKAAFLVAAGKHYAGMSIEEKNSIPRFSAAIHRIVDRIEDTEAGEVFRSAIESCGGSVEAIRECLTTGMGRDYQRAMQLPTHFDKEATEWFKSARFAQAAIEGLDKVARVDATAAALEQAVSDGIKRARQEAVIEGTRGSLESAIAAFAKLENLLPPGWQIRCNERETQESQGYGPLEEINYIGHLEVRAVDPQSNLKPLIVAITSPPSSQSSGSGSSFDHYVHSYTITKDELRTELQATFDDAGR
jgi:hypothetical protein